MSNQFDALTNADKIQQMIDKIEQQIGFIPEATFEKANSLAAYDRQIAITILKIKNGLMTKWEYEPGKFLPLDGIAATNIPVIAKGICSIEALQKESGDAGYKGLITTIDAMKAMLNGYQSLHKILQ